VPRIHNHKNFTKSLVEKHQHLQLFHLLSPNYFYTDILGSREVNIDPSHSDLISNLIYDYDIGLVSNFDLKRDLTYFKWVQFDMFEYNLGDMICYNNTEMPKFGKIIHLVVAQTNLIFILEPFITETYRKYQMAYLLKQNHNHFNLIAQPLKSLRYKNPMDLYKLPNNELIISPKFPL